jgi:hypothetical protein
VWLPVKAGEGDGGGRPSDIRLNDNISWMVCSHRSLRGHLAPEPRELLEEGALLLRARVDVERRPEPVLDEEQRVGRHAFAAVGEAHPHMGWRRVRSPARRVLRHLAPDGAERVALDECVRERVDSSGRIRWRRRSCSVHRPWLRLRPVLDALVLQAPVLGMEGDGGRAHKLDLVPVGHGRSSGGAGSIDGLQLSGSRAAHECR